MGSLLIQVAIYGLAAALAAPVAIVVSALILGKSARPVLGAWTFGAGHEERRRGRPPRAAARRLYRDTRRAES